MANLPKEIVYPTQRKRLQKVIIGTISLFLVFNVMVYFFLRNYPYSFSTAIIIEKWNLLEKIKGKEISCLLLGDSAGNQGLDTDLFPNPESTYNLCTIGSFTLYDDILMLKYLIDNQTIPKKIVIVHVYDVWERNLSKTGFQHTPIQYFSTKNHLGFVEIETKEQIELLRDRFFPVYSQKETLSLLVINPKSASQLHYFSKNGFMPQKEAREENVLIDVEGHKKTITNRKFELSQVNQKSLEYLISIIEKYKIPTYIVESPIAQNLFDNKDYKIYNHSIQEKLKNIASKSSYLNFIAFDERTFSAKKMQNADHLTQQAAIEYTKNVIKKIEEF